MNRDQLALDIFQRTSIPSPSLTRDAPCIIIKIPTPISKSSQLISSGVWPGRKRPLNPSCFIHYIKSTAAENMVRLERARLFRNYRGQRISICERIVK